MTTTMKVAVKGFCGVRKADIEFSGMLLLAGRNGAGKTSICRAVGAALAGVPMPFLCPSASKPGSMTVLLPKQRGDDVVNAGASSPTASVTVSVSGPAGNGTASVAWPDARTSRRGTMPACSPAAAGLVRIPDLDRRAMAAMLVDRLEATPTKEDLDAAAARIERLAGGFFDDAAAPDFAAALADVVTEAWGCVSAGGWDKAATEMAAEATQRKGAWQSVTGERYGTEKACTWTPDAGWSRDLIGADLKALARATEDAQRACLEAMSAAAVDAAERERMAGVVASIPSLEAALSEASASEARAKQDHMAALAARDNLPAIFGQSGLPCPHCGKFVRVAKHPSGQQFFERFEEATSLEDAAKREKELREAGAAVKATGAARDAASDRHAAARAALEAAKAAKEKLQALPASGAGREAAASQRAAAAAALEKAKQREDAARRFSLALGHATLVAAYATVADLLKPTGVRRDVLKRKLDAFNGRLAALCEIAGWPAVHLTEDLDVRCSGRPALLMSASERYRCDVLLQLAIAEIEGSGVVIIDGADILDRDNRNGLIKALRSLPVTAIVTMTANSPAVMPDLHKAGWGETYWIEDGTAMPLATALSCQAAAE